MTRVGWLADSSDLPGGAEFTQAEFRAAAPGHVEIVDCPPGEIDRTCDRYVIQNCVKYSVDDLKPLRTTLRPVFKYWHDVGPWVQDGVREWLDKHAQTLCCSPLQAEYMELGDYICIPPPVDLARFQEAGDQSNGNRSGAVCVGSWRNYGKAPHKALQWGQDHGGIDFYGGGPLAPPGSIEISYDAMPELLARYDTFVFLPSVIEPFGRVVAEAWAAGCNVIVNGLVGARYWLEEDPEAIDTAAQDFWRVVLQ